MKTNEITGIVLAGGKSSRMGTDKSLLEWRGKTFIEHSIDKLKPLCSKVIISSNKQVYTFTGCETWPDILPVQAPIVGIYSCLKRSETEINFVLSCDMPLIKPELFDYLFESLKKYEVVVPTNHNNQIEPLCGVYKKSVTSDIQRYIATNNLSIYKFLEICSTLYLKIDSRLNFYTNQMFSNINTKDDLKNLPR